MLFGEKSEKFSRRDSEAEVLVRIERALCV